MTALKQHFEKADHQHTGADQIERQSSGAIAAKVSFPMPHTAHVFTDDSLQRMVNPLSEADQNTCQRDQLDSVNCVMADRLEGNSQRDQQKDGAEREHGFVPLIDFQRTKRVVHRLSPLRALLGNSKRNAKRVTCEVVSCRSFLASSYLIAVEE
ncbi:hypothetical protein [Kushneria sinocarnis]|uniref:hypothetical protein n=1 Tax=Kushneria sinocarnis TaxID=595502 RepID=UPI0011C3E918|nr:hypothetical protein [Kushneria sinocarnis]